MTWQEAADWVEYLLRTVTASIPLTLYGFSIWSIPYLLQKGFSIEQILAFGRTAREMLVKSLDDVEVEFQAEETEMATIVDGWPPWDHRIDSVQEGIPTNVIERDMLAVS